MSEEQIHKTSTLYQCSIYFALFCCNINGISVFAMMLPYRAKEMHSLSWPSLCVYSPLILMVKQEGNIREHPWSLRTTLSIQSKALSQLISKKPLQQFHRLRCPGPCLTRLYHPIHDADVGDDRKGAVEEGFGMGCGMGPSYDNDIL